LTTATESDPCPALLVSIAGVSLIALVVWMVKPPRALVGYRNAKPLYGVTIEWPVAFLVIMSAVSAHFTAAHISAYTALLHENRKALASGGIYLLFTIGALAYSKVREKRALRVACFAAGAFGLFLICAFKWTC
jgi:hypothetical protein